MKRRIIAKTGRFYKRRLRETQYNRAALAVPDAARNPWFFDRVPAFRQPRPLSRCGYPEVC